MGDMVGRSAFFVGLGKNTHNSMGKFAGLARIVNGGKEKFPSNLKPLARGNHVEYPHYSCLCVIDDRMRFCTCRFRCCWPHNVKLLLKLYSFWFLQDRHG
jgi:hypothetical protein